MRSSYYLKDLLDFGVYKGQQVGIVYLFDPHYFNWLLLKEGGDFCIKDIKDTIGLRCIHIASFENRVATAHERMQVEAIAHIIENKFDFEDIKYSGTYFFKFSEIAMKNNNDRLLKLGHHLFVVKWHETEFESEYDSLYEADYDEMYKDKIFFLHAQIDLWIPVTDFKYHSRGKTKNGKNYAVYSFDNSWCEVRKLPSISNCLVAILLVDDLPEDTVLADGTFGWRNGIVFEDIL